jgi:sigma-B regulation protein RsbU (phosphoserine phosphatase)
MQFATLVCGKTNARGQVEICNAGHIPPLHIGAAGVIRLETTGLPLGMFGDQQFSISTIAMAPGDSLAIYTDGISEAQNKTGSEYGEEQLRKTFHECRSLSPKELVGACIEGLRTFCSEARQLDDQTLLIVQFQP